MPTRARRHVLLVGILAAYLVALAFIAFWPVPVDSGERGNLLALLHRLRGGVFGWIDYAVVETTANVLLFVPFGFLSGVLGGPRRRLLMLAVCVAASILIELGQALLLPARVASVGDVLANALGAVLGALLAVLVDVLERRRGRRPSGAS